MMVKKKKKQSSSQSSSEKKKTLEPKLSKLENGKDSEHMIRGMSSTPEQGLSSSQSRVVRCPKCHKFLQEPLDVTIYKCSGCNSILQAKRLELENNDNSIHQEDLSSSQHRSLTPVRSIYRKYSSRASPSVETAYRRHETSYEWMTSAAASARSSPYALKLSITKKEDTTLLDLLKFVDSGTSFAEETVAHHLSSSDKGSGDRICISTDAVKERDTRRSTSSEYIDLKLGTLQPQWNHKLTEQQQPASRFHLEEGGGGSKTPVRSSYRKYSSRASSPLFETGYRRRHETSYTTRSASPSPSSYGYTSPFHWSQVSSSAAASPIRFQGETSDQKYYHWSSLQSQIHDSQLSTTKKEETLLTLFRFVDSGTSFAEEALVIHQNQDDSASESHLSCSDNGSGDRVDPVTLETFEDKGVKEANIRSISSKFIDLTFQPQWNHKLRTQASLGSGEMKERMSDSSIETETVEPLDKKEHVCETNVLSVNNTRDTKQFDLGEVKWEDILGELLLEKSPYTGEASICDSSSKEDTNSLLAKEKQSCFIENPDQSGKDTVRSAYMIHEEQSKDDECENISERQESLDKTINDRVKYELEETNEALEQGKDGCVVSLKKTSETSIQVESQNNSYYEGVERRWAETMEDRAGLHLEEYETNYDENYRNPFEWSSEGAVPTFHMHEYESTTLEETFGLTEITTPMFCLNEPELLEPDNEAEEGSSESSSFNSSHESSQMRAVFHQEEEDEPQVVMTNGRNEMVSVKLEDIFEWTSERAPTFRLYDEPKLGPLLEPDQDAFGRSESSSRDHVIPKEREMMDHGEVSKLVTDEDEPWLVEIDVMAAEDGPSLDLEKFQNEKMLLEDKRVEPREDIFRLSLDDRVEQEWVKFDSETSLEDMQVILRQTVKQGDTAENIPQSGSVLSSERYESPSKIAQVESEAEEEILRGHLGNFQKKNDKSGGLTSEIVGLRHALYQTQTQTSPLSSPFHSPIGSPMHILNRSPVASPLRSHAVSPLRSPTNTSGSLPDVLFSGKKI